MPNKRVASKDPDLAKVGVALKRAAAKARQLGFDTNTPVYVFRDGKIVDIVAEEQGTHPLKKSRANGSKRSKPPLGKKTTNSKTNR